MRFFVNDILVTKALKFSTLQVAHETLSMLVLMKTLRFTTLPGDGIGPEVMDVALKVLQKLGNLHDFSIETAITMSAESVSTTTEKHFLIPHLMPARKSMPFFSVQLEARNGKTFPQRTTRTSRSSSHSKSV